MGRLASHNAAAPYPIELFQDLGLLDLVRVTGFRSDFMPNICRFRNDATHAPGEGGGRDWATDRLHTFGGMSKRLDLDDLLGTAPRRSKAEQLAEFKVTLGKVEKEEEEKIIEGSARKRPRSEGTEKWWEIPERTLTPELKRDLQIIQSRGYIDPKRFYKVRLVVVPSETRPPNSGHSRSVLSSCVPRRRIRSKRSSRHDFKSEPSWSLRLMAPVGG